MMGAMTLPVINDVYRCTLNWPTNLGVAPRSVFHVHASGIDEAAVVSQINAAHQANMFWPMSQAYDCINIDCIKLDGTSATFTGVLTSGRYKGVQTGSDQNPAVAAVVSFRTLQRGPRGRGRMYVGPITETGQANGVLDATGAGLMAVGWAAWISAMNSANVPLVVASYAHADYHEVTSFAIDALVGVQRRRQDQLR
jgi:hypothetical protein